MIDLHCHILPKLDDGAQSLEDALAMAEKAVEEGITTIVATPHHQNGNYENTKLDIMNEVIGLNRLLEKYHIDLEVLPGQECRLYGELMEDYYKGEILTLANSNYIFVEFPSGYVPRFAKQMFYEIQLSGLIPVIVHPERNQQLMEEPERLYEFVKNGALTQVTAGSVVGKFGKKIKSFTEEMMGANLTHFIASDAHNITSRNYHMTEAYDTIQQEYGEGMVYFYKENAQLVIENGHVMTEIPEKIQRRKKIFGLF
ncbi:protein-tyrosine phosphatase [Evansella vedderi]|uniref:Tyrosine-protein phosphatase n=1 Tax=Evansella vedderi TaxID=38282 RepID=A0ABT9ZUR5_9BACI|nr:CpsB/CapC family capsule biosynthesis tyrosine phosphatase [Evansella vedderi]MDQ0254456.1 protein-tyrosine phosphatase [Evansella vedderi]